MSEDERHAQYTAVARDVLAYLTASHGELHDEADAILQEYLDDRHKMMAFVTLLGIEATNSLTLLSNEAGVSVEDMLVERGLFIGAL